jgi:hypothetical protein
MWFYMKYIEIQPYKKVIPNISRPKKSQHFLMHWMSVKLPDNFQMLKLSWPCRFHIRSYLTKDVEKKIKLLTHLLTKIALNLVRSETHSKYRKIEREVVLDNHKQRWPTMIIIFMM